MTVAHRYRGLNFILFSIALIAMVLTSSLAVLAASSNVSVNVCSIPNAISIISPAEGSINNNAAVVVSGYGPANTNIVLFRNDQQSGSVTSGTDGSYSISVPLDVNQNTLYARITDICGNSSQSSLVSVYRQLPKKSTGSNNSNTSNQPRVNNLSVQPSDKSIGDITQPKISEPLDGTSTTSPTVFVKGMSQTGVKVKLIRNGTIVAEVMADDDAQFAAAISLVPGENILQASVQNGQSELMSESVRINYQAASSETVAPVQELPN